MRLITPDSLHYPITVTKLRLKESQDVANSAPLFDYEYKTKVLEGSEDDKEGKLVDRTFPSTFQSSVEGSLSKWLIHPGLVITRPRTPVADIEEPCKHEVQFGGMCAICGKDMTTVDYNTVIRDTDRATVNTVHGHTALLVSPAEASKSDEEAKRRLLSSRKLSLVVDLDQTIIHATVDPTVAEWQNDSSNPNHDAVKDVQAFQLIDDGPGARGCWYYIKLRPGLKEFLDRISKFYELHIYTMGTRAYAQNIAKIVDPDRKIFGDRILSRDESGSMTVKNLKRLFPVDTKMVVIIDDRGDVWHWSQNLVKVTPYDFFVGIGDINSSFLPKRPGIDTMPPPPPPKPEAKSNGDTDSAVKAEESNASTDHKHKHARPVSATPVEPQTNGDVSAIDQLMSMGAGNDATKLQEQTTQQDETIAAQLADRPLLQKQKMLDAVDESNSETPTPGQNGGSEAEQQHDRHNLLQDNDTELQYLQQSLSKVHQRFFDEYDRRLKGSQGGRVSELRPGPAKKRSFDDLEILPDVTGIMASMKLNVLKGVSLVFSGVVPLGVDIQSHDLAVWAKSFGASVTENISKRTTHVIASPQRRTAKVRQAAKRSDRIHIVNQQWLFDSLSRWSRVAEDPYRIHSDISHHDDKPSSNSPPNFEDPAVLSSSDEEAALTESDPETPINPTNAPDADPETETEAELAALMPSMSREDSSPNDETKEDWDGMNDELAEFLGSEDEDGSDASEAESVRSTSRKRKRGAPSTDGQSTDDDSAAESRLQRRKRKALARTSSLNNAGATLGTTEVQDDDEDDLEAELAAEMARMEEEEADAEGDGEGKAQEPEAAEFMAEKKAEDSDADEEVDGVV
ncbi:hypothetical protein K461DRAFT_150894 [Myriangium duriaei CBS 260.36]|uniref:RNA polymerase II subunit A C-terminal domain phosphatase n=1 Tax=Myriangium duriaei CBS 260.36 TaxID=1168546 RepID=A0A9P4J1F9_9PEZI|nr:hypothetical protein K461DRAFT_150894 [Myriangium duriaei CBS 260.36]